MISGSELYLTLYNNESKFESSLMTNIHIRNFLMYLIKELSVLPNGKLVSIVYNSENTALVNKLIVLCKFMLDTVLTTYPGSDDEYNFVYNVLNKILTIFGIVTSSITLPEIHTIDQNGFAYEFIPEPLSNLTMFTLLRGVDWINNKKPGEERIGLINISDNFNYDIPGFVKHLPIKYRILSDVCTTVKNHLHLEHCQIPYPNSTHFSLIDTAIHIRNHDIVELNITTDELLDFLNSITKDYDTKILYFTLWVVNLLYYRYGNDEILSKYYINTAHSLAKKHIKKNYLTRFAQLLALILYLLVIAILSTIMLLIIVIVY